MMVRLPTPPSTNGLFFNLRKGGRAPTRKYTAWQTEAGWMLKQKPVMSFGQMLVQVRIWIPRKSRIDIDNGSKAVLDLLQTHGIFKNDKQVERLTIERHDDKDALVEVTPYSESNSPERRVAAAGMQ
jgi:crossover junction endodeoxyribonuclease RusA